MRKHVFHYNIQFAFAILAMLVIAPSMLLAQGETFTDCDAWRAAVCGSVFEENYDSFVGFDGEPLSDNFLGAIPTPQTVAWGEVSQERNFPEGISFFASPLTESPRGMFFDESGVEGRPVVFTPNTTALGQLEGVCFTYALSAPEVTGRFKAFDGDTLVASIVLPNESVEEGGPVFSTFGWINSEGLDVTRFEFAVDNFEGDLGSGIVTEGFVSFGEGCEPPAVSCFDQLAVVEGNVSELVDTLSGNDAYFAQGSLDCINWMQNDCFWEQPSGNRLSRYGGSMFIGAAYAVCYLEWVDDPQADVLIDELVAVLECIVDYEIAYAIENGGSQCFIDRAEDYAELGEIIDEDFNNEVVATLAYRLAWLNAYYATQ